MWLQVLFRTSREAGVPHEHDGLVLGMRDQGRGLEDLGHMPTTYWGSVLRKWLESLVVTQLGDL